MHFVLITDFCFVFEKLGFVFRVFHSLDLNAGISLVLFNIFLCLNFSCRLVVALEVESDSDLIFFFFFQDSFIGDVVLFCKQVPNFLFLFL